MSRPVIGITLDSEKPGCYSNLPWYALRQNYTDAVAEAGAFHCRYPTSRTRPTPISISLTDWSSQAAPLTSTHPFSAPTSVTPQS